MMSQLRWALLVVGVVFIVILAWWERRRPRQASGAFERASARETAADPPPRRVREPPLTLPEMRTREPVVARELPVVAVREEPSLPVVGSPAHGQGDPLGAADEADTTHDLSATDEMRALDELDGLDALEGLHEQDARQGGSAMRPAREEAADEAPDEAADEAAGVPPIAAASPAPALEAAVSAAGLDVESTHEMLPERSADALLVVDWPPEHQRRILALRLVARQRERFAGRPLRQALAAEGFLLGQFAIFHKPDEARRAVLSAASLTRPGTFDMETMDSQHYSGLSLFAVLPGPKSPPQAFDELVCAARNLNERLHGVLQDEQGTPLTPARIAQLREQLRPGAHS
jgi:cell division protein ZipA